MTDKVELFLTTVKDLKRLLENIEWDAQEIRRRCSEAAADCLT